jgi:putative hydrolase
MYFGYYHTHTTLSHGKGGIEDNVIAAIKLGLKEIAITDHGFGHGCYAVKRNAFDIARAEVVCLREKYPEINIMLGLECNMLTADGQIDLKEGEKDKLDIILCGFHKVVRTDLLSALGFCFPNVLGVGSRQAVVKNTDAYVKLIEKNEIDVLTHINCAIKADAVEVAKACKHY